MKTLFFAGLVAIGLFLGCASKSRTIYTTLAALGQSVDAAEREYLDRALARTVSTNNYPQIQYAYKGFQVAYSNAVWAAAGDTNVLAPLNLTQQGADLLFIINSAIGK